MHARLLPLLLLPCLAAHAQTWELDLAPGGNEPRLYELRRLTAPVVTADFAFWGANWGWTGTTISTTNPLRPTLAARALGLAADVALTPTEGGWDAAITFEAEGRAEATGGGLVFNLALGGAALPAGAGQPELLPDNTGWTWDLGNGERAEARFDRPVATVYFERGQRNQARAFFFAGSIPAGRHAWTLRITVPPGTQRTRPLAERYAAPSATWLLNALDPHAAFIDLSGMNEKPAGHRGRPQVRGDGYILGDGTPIRFWGANVQAYSLFVPDHDRIDQHAKRLARLGFNLVRLHHHDSTGWVNPSLIADGPDSRVLNERALDTYFYWIHALRREGIYVWIDLHTGRLFRAGDNIPGWEDFARGQQNLERGARGAGFMYVNPRVEELQDEFNRQLLARRNPYTDLALKDDPAVMGILLANEHDLTHHFGNALLGDKGVPHHHALFARAADAFAQRTGLDREALLRTWEPGPSKLLLNDLERAWSLRRIEHLRTLGVRAPIATGHQWGGNPLFSLPALLAGDVLDAHGYEEGEFTSRNPRARAHLLHWLAAAQYSGRPLAITEWNTEDSANARDPFTVPLFVAALGAFQGWDAPMLYGYSQDGLRGTGFSAWSSYNLPHIAGLMPAAAVLFREGHVRPADRTVFVQLDRGNAFLNNVSPATSRTLRTAAERHRVVIGFTGAPELPWLEATPVPQGAQVVTDLQRDFADGETFVTSDTGEVRRDWARGLQIVSTPRTQAVVGWMDGGPVHLPFVSFDIRTPKAAVVLTALDGRPLLDSRRILVTAVAQARRAPNGIVSEPVEGTLTVRRTGQDLRLTPLRADGSRGAPVARAPDAPQGTQAFTIGAADATHWYLLE